LRPGVRRVHGPLFTPVGGGVRRRGRCPSGTVRSCLPRTILQRIEAQVVADDILAAAILDRLLQHCDVIAINRPGYRLKNRLPRSPPTSPAPSPPDHPPTLHVIHTRLCTWTRTPTWERARPSLSREKSQRSSLASNQPTNTKDVVTLRTGRRAAVPASTAEQSHQRRSANGSPARKVAPKELVTPSERRLRCARMGRLRGRPACGGS
jgi:hypothetical protein